MNWSGLLLLLGFFGCLFLFTKWAAAKDFDQDTNCRKADKYVNNPGQNRQLTKDGCNKVEFEKTDQAPIQASHNQQYKTNPA
jgi:hypothetical protein